MNNPLWYLALVTVWMNGYSCASSNATECKIDNDCHQNEACVNYKCQGACTNHACGENAQCSVHNHVANCMCLPGLTGNPAVICYECPECWPPRNAGRKYFRLGDSVANWHNAYKGCMSTGGRLASIRTKQEIAEVKELATYLNSGEYLWTSGKKVKNIGVNAKEHWYWMSVGLPIPMQGEDSDWNPQRPFWNDGHEVCMVVGRFPEVPLVIQWYDAFCTGWLNITSVCEYYE